jgi:1-acyl-sn-glycerol-3-phosphate acyltransferase
MRRNVTWNIVHAVSRVTAAILWDLKVWGAENVPKTGGALIVSNHQSFLDPVVIALRLYRPISYFARADLFDNPLFGWFIRSLNAFPVRRGESDIGAMREAVRRLSEGHLLCFYPEGKRTRNGELSPIQKGITLVIRKANVPVIPVVIDGAYQALPRHGQVQAKPIRVLFGPPLDVKGRSADEIVRDIDEKFHSMQARLRGWQSRSVRGFRPPPP